MADYSNLILSRKGPVATIALLNFADIAPGRRRLNHPEVASALNDLRQDDDVRVIILTGAGDQFKVPQPREFYSNAEGSKHLVEPEGAWQTFTGIIKCHQLMAEMEKPIVARVNGDAIGFGSSLVFSSDLIVAREDAIFLDSHMAGVFLTKYGGEIRESGHSFNTVPGDGGLASVPLYMSPCRAKEYLMLGRRYEARELASLGIINYAVPASELDSKVDELVQKLLERNPHAVAWTKRVANRRFVEHMNMTLDAGVAYEMVTLLQNDMFGRAEKEKKARD